MQLQQERHQREVGELHNASRGYLNVINSPIRSPLPEQVESTPTESVEEKLAKELEDERRKLAELQEQLKIQSSTPPKENTSMMTAEENSDEEKTSEKIKNEEEEEEEDEPEEVEREITEEHIESPDTKKKVMTVTPLRKHLYRPTKVNNFIFINFVFLTN